MKKLIILFLQLTVVLFIVFFITSFDKKIDFFWNGIVFSSNTKVFLTIIAALIFFTLLAQRLYLYIRNSPKRIKEKMKINRYQKCIDAIVKAIVALSNSDNKELAIQSRKIDNYIKDSPINLVLKAEAARKEKRFSIAEENYNKMLLNKETKILGLRGLLEQNLKSQDYHHALIYAEQIYNINHKLEWIYKTITEILIKTKNWQKLIEINNDAERRKVIPRNNRLKSNAVAQYEIALIKEGASIREALKLLSDANDARPNFPPIASKFIDLLVSDKQFNKAKKILFRSWAVNPHPMFFKAAVNIAKEENLNIVSFVNKLTNKNKEHYESIVARIKSSILEKNWQEAKGIIKSILSSKPNKTICQLMYEIELGMSGNMQKADSWNKRSLIGDPERTWVCKHTKDSQEKWFSISKNGFFDSLEWSWPEIGINYRVQQEDNLIPSIIG